MTFEADLKAHLSDASIASVVGERVFPIVRPQSSPLPAITFQRIAGVPQTELDGGDGALINIRPQIDVWSKTHDQAKSIAEAVRLRMQIPASSFRALMLTDGDLYEDDTRLFRVSMDFSCWYRTS